MKWRHDLQGKTMQQRVIIDKTTNQTQNNENNELKMVSKKRNINLYEHEFEVIVSEKDLITGKYRATVNYVGYPEHIAVEYGDSEDDAIDKTVRKMLDSSPFEAIRCLYE